MLTEKTTRKVLPLTVAMLLVAVSAGGCGDSSSGSIAVQIGHKSISQRSVMHWMEVIAGEISTSPRQPKPSVPSPPEYTACIVYKRKYPLVPTGARSTLSQLRRECAVEFEKEKLKALYFLISSQWLAGAASELGMGSSTGELPRQAAQLEKRFPNSAIARRFLVGTRGTQEDLLARLNAVALTTKIQQKLEARSRQKGLDKPQRQQALDEFGQSFESVWRARTSCRPGYVVPICEQSYKPTKAASTLVPPDIPLTKMTVE